MKPAATVLRGNAAHELVCTVPPCPRDQFHRPIRRRLLWGRGVGSPCLDALGVRPPLILAHSTLDVRLSTAPIGISRTPPAACWPSTFDLRPSTPLIGVRLPWLPSAGRFRPRTKPSKTLAFLKYSHFTVFLYTLSQLSKPLVPLANTHLGPRRDFPYALREVQKTIGTIG